MNHLNADFINLTPENLAVEHLCCIIRSKKPHPGVEAKRQWLAQRLGEGHVFRKLNDKGCVFIEYAPLETAWVPIVGENFLYIYCLWATAPYKDSGKIQIPARLGRASCLLFRPLTVQNKKRLSAPFGQT